MSDPRVRIGNRSDGSCNCCEYPDTELVSRRPVLVFSLGGMTVRLCRFHYEVVALQADGLTERKSSDVVSQYFHEISKLEAVRHDAEDAEKQLVFNCDNIWNKMKPDERQKAAAIIEMSGGKLHNKH